MDSDTDNEVEIDRPSPADFDAFVPWACNQLQCDFNVVITRTEQTDYCQGTSSDISRRKCIKPEKDESGSDTLERKEAKSNIADMTNTVVMQTIYENYDSLIQIKFNKNQYLPRILLQVIGLVTQFHPRLNTISIDRGIKQDGIYELCKVISVSRITEVILDNVFLLEANYYLLLDINSPLKYLSLARCKIDDNALQAIAVRLTSSSRAAKSLSVLNLSTNIISDIGAEYIGNALKTNRQISYLNLAGNRITDKGAEFILNSLDEFMLTDDDIQEKKARHVAYLNEKHELAKEIYKELCIDDAERRGKARKSTKAMAPISVRGKVKAIEKENSLKNIPPSVTTNDPTAFDKAEAAAEDKLGLFEDPYSSENIVIRDGVVYCLGNNTLCYLSLAYNNISYLSVKKLYHIFSRQNFLNRKPKGLVNVCIDGNKIPQSCDEMTDIDAFIESGLALLRRTSVISKKKPLGKSGK